MMLALTNKFGNLTLVNYEKILSVQVITSDYVPDEKGLTLISFKKHYVVVKESPKFILDQFASVNG